MNRLAAAGPSDRRTSSWGRSAERASGEPRPSLPDAPGRPRTAHDRPPHRRSLGAPRPVRPGPRSFGSPPKFPSASTLEFLLRMHHGTGDESALEMVQVTLDKMALSAPDDVQRFATRKLGTRHCARLPPAVAARLQFHHCRRDACLGELLRARPARPRGSRARARTARLCTEQGSRPTRCRAVRRSHRRALPAPLGSARLRFAR